MKIFLSITNSSRDYFLAFSIKRLEPKVCMYHESEYLRILNSMLSLELGTVDLYGSCKNLPTSDIFIKSFENHLDNVDQLRALIVSNCGIPDFESTDVSSELCMIARRVGSQFGKTISHVTAVNLCLNRENLLRKKYLEVLSQAPFKDRSKLNSLLLNTKSNLICLKPYK